MNNFIQFTALTSAEPNLLTKVLSLNADGTFKKTSVVTMVEGYAERRAVKDLNELAAVLESLQPSQAVSWGICLYKRVKIVPSAEETNFPGAISRTRKNFAYPKGPGVMMLDHDGGNGEHFTAERLQEILVSLCPPLAGASMLCRPSASAGVYAPDGRIITPLFKHRLYIPVADASLIPEAGKILEALIWAANYGWFEVGSAGQALKRGLLDTSVWQPERLDFAAPPILRDGLTRPYVAPVVKGDPLKLFDLSLITADTKTRRLAAAAQKEARNKVRTQCSEIRERWIESHAVAFAQERGLKEVKAREVLRRAGERSILTGEFMLTAQGGKRVSVEQLLADPSSWHQRRFSDPLGGYPEDDRIAYANLLGGGRPTLYTHGHGGMVFDLTRQSVRIQIGKGLRVQATDATLEALREQGDLYDFGDGDPVYITEGKARPVTAEWLVDYMGRQCEFFSLRTEDDEFGHRNAREIQEDAPMSVARAIMAKNGQRGFRRLQAVITAPILRIDGSILDMPGYDEASGLLYVNNEIESLLIPVSPTPVEAIDTLDVLLTPFAGFPFVDETALGVLLAAALTAVLRPSLPTAPGIGLDAPAAGTGKTLLARCLGILATGTDPSILPPADAEEETRKRLFSALRECASVILWDNVQEPLGGAALDSFLTAAMFSDRILGASQTATLPNRALFIATGNNLRLLGDTCRRILVS